MKRAPRSYDYLLMLFVMAGVEFAEAQRLARQFAEPAK